jgi:hypothetical protein
MAKQLRKNSFLVGMLFSLKKSIIAKGVWQRKGCSGTNHMQFAQTNPDFKKRSI